MRGDSTGHTGNQIGFGTSVWPLGQPPAGEVNISDRGVVELNKLVISGDAAGLDF